MHSLIINLLFCLLISFVPANALPKRDSIPIPPSQDPFYLPPAGYESAAPGTILRSRPAPSHLAAFQLTPLNPKSVTQILYRTTDSLGNPEVTVTTIIVPYNANYERLISYQIATDAAYINCAPSYTLQTGTNVKYAGTGSVEVFLVTAALNQGWVVSLPDWEGPNATFVEGRQAGQSTLDSVRAALKSTSITGILPNASYAMWGYSGGALASEWAAELNTKYAPELSFVGAAIGGLTPNVQNVYATINNGLFAGLANAALLGLANGLPAFKQALLPHLVPEKEAEFNQAQTQCFFADTVGYAFQNVSTYFVDGANVLNDPVISHTFNTTVNQGFNGVPQMPLFVYKAQNDEISPIADTDALVAKYCAAGVDITYVRDAFGEHFVQAATSLGDVINFFIARFEGQPLTGCSTRDSFLDALDPGAPGVLGPFIVDALLDFIGTPIGPTNF